MADGSGERHGPLPDQLTRNSIYLVAATAATAALGFAFWMVVARLFDPAEVGIGTSLVSAVSIISLISLFGLNGTIVRFLHGTRDPDVLITQCLIVVGLGAMLLAVGYLFLVPLYAPPLSFVAESPLFAVAFTLTCVCAGMNYLTDAVFIAVRRPEFNLLTDGAIQGVVRLALPVALAGIGSFGILVAVGGGFAAALVASIFVMLILGFEPRFRLRPVVTAVQFRFAMTGFASNALSVAPTLLLPLIALHARGEADAGFFYIAFQVASFLYATSGALGEALLSEGSLAGSVVDRLLGKSMALLLSVQLAGIAVLLLGGRLVLALVGSDYSREAADVLWWLALGALPVALNTWAGFLLRLTGQLRSLVVSSVVFCGVTLVLAQLYAAVSLEWLAWAWIAGNTAGAIVAIAALAAGRTRRSERVA